MLYATDSREEDYELSLNVVPEAIECDRTGLAGRSRQSLAGGRQGVAGATLVGRDRRDSRKRLAPGFLV